MDRAHQTEHNVEVAGAGGGRAEALRQSHEELVQLAGIAGLGVLTGSIVQEVNQPLAGITSNAHAILGWLDQWPPDVAEVRLAVGNIIRDTDRAGDIIRRIRALFEKPDLDRVPLDINGVIRDAMFLVRHEATSRQVSVQLKLASGLPKVAGDRARLQQAIANLALNGLEAMMDIARPERTLLVRSYLAETGQVIVEVQDHGHGIGPENADRLFAPFFTTKRNGMGMGLSICHSIIESHGGRLWVSPNVGPGTSVRFALGAQGSVSTEK